MSVSQSSKILVLIIGMLSSVSQDTSKRLYGKVCCTNIKGISKLLGIMILIGQDLLWIDAPLHGIVFSLEETLFLGKAKNDVVAQSSVEV